MVLAENEYVEMIGLGNEEAARLKPEEDSLADE